MKLTTNLTDLNKLESASIKAKKLCIDNKCGLLDLIVLSIQVNADNNANKRK